MTDDPGTEQPSGPRAGGAPEAAVDAPPVVAVMVVHEPGPWFDEVLDSLARQDYPNLRLLFLVAGAQPAVMTEIGQRLPGSLMRALGDNPASVPAANQALRLVRAPAASSASCTTTSRSTPRASASSWPRRTARTPASWGPSWSTGTARACSSTSGSVPTASASPWRRPRRGSSTRSSTTPCATCSACRLPACSSASTSSASWAASPGHRLLRRRPRPVLAGAPLRARVLVVPAARVRHRRAPAGASSGPRRARALGTSPVADVVVGTDRLPPGRPLRAPRAVHLGNGRRARERAGHEVRGMLGAWVWQLIRLPALFARRRRFQSTRQVSGAEVASLQGVRGSARLRDSRRQRSSRARGPQRPAGRARRRPASSSAATTPGRTSWCGRSFWPCCSSAAAS